MSKLRQDLRALSGLRRFGFLPVDLSFAPDGSPFMAAELLVGETLRVRLQRGPLPVLAAGIVTAALARALAEAHKQNVVHGDLRPENVILPTEAGREVEAGQPVLLDAALHHLRKRAIGLDESLPLGKLAYLAPEQASGEQQSADNGGDIFALGAILYECLTGKQAFVTEGIFSPPNIGSLGSNQSILVVHPSILPPVAPNTPLYALTNPDSGNSSQSSQSHQNAMQISPRSPIGINRNSPPPGSPSPSSIQVPPRSNPLGNQIGSASLVPQNNKSGFPLNIPQGGASNSQTSLGNIQNQSPVTFTQVQSGNPQNLNLNSQTFHPSSGNSPQIQIPSSGNSLGQVPPSNSFPPQQISGNTSQITFGGSQNPPPQIPTSGNSLAQVPPSNSNPSQILSGTSQNSPVVPALNLNLNSNSGNVPITTAGSNQDKQLVKNQPSNSEENLKLREQVKQEKEQISKKIQTVQDRLQKVLSETSMKSGKSSSEPQKIIQQEKPLLVTVDRLNHFSGFLNLQANFVLPTSQSQQVNSPSSISPQSISPFQRLQKSPNSIHENPSDSQNSENSDSPIRLSSISTPGKYSSPLQIFRGYRLSPHFALTGKSRIAPEFVFSFNPKNVLCRFELHGVCNDDQCPWEHFRTSKRNTTQLVDSFVEYAKQRSPFQRTFSRTSQTNSSDQTTNWKCSY